MERHVEEHGVEPDRITHYGPTDAPNIARFAPKGTGDVLLPNGFHMSHETHGLCFMHYGDLCSKYGCTLLFCMESLAEVHKLKHLPPKDYQGSLVCPGCQYLADNPRTLFDHIGQHGAARTDRKRCRLCGEFIVDIQQHAARRHADEYQQFLHTYRPVACDQCEKRYKTGALLKQHKTNVHGTKLPQCFICAKQFATTGLLKQHSEEHRTETGLVCPTCRRSFQTYRAFSIHTKTHNIKQICVCDVCQAIFADPGKLAQHKTVHETDYKYNCDQCGKSFKRPGNLWQHRKCVHTDFYTKKRKLERDEMKKTGVVVNYVCPRRTMRYEDYPFKCEECHLGWLKLGALEQHKMRKHAASGSSA